MVVPCMVGKPSDNMPGAVCTFDHGCRKDADVTTASSTSCSAFDVYHPGRSRLRVVVVVDDPLMASDSDTSGRLPYLQHGNGYSERRNCGSVDVPLTQLPYAKRCGTALDMTLSGYEIMVSDWGFCDV